MCCSHPVSCTKVSETAAHGAVPADTGTARAPALQPGTHLSTRTELPARSQDLIQLSSPAQPSSQLHSKKSVRQDTEDCLIFGRHRSVCLYQPANLHNIHQTFQANSYRPWELESTSRRQSQTCSLHTDIYPLSAISHGFLLPNCF